MLGLTTDPVPQGANGSNSPCREYHIWAESATVLGCSFFGGSTRGDNHAIKDTLRASTLIHGAHNIYFSSQKEWQWKKEKLQSQGESVTLTV